MNPSEAMPIKSRAPSVLTLVFLSTWLVGFAAFVYFVIQLAGPGPFASALAILEVDLPVLTVSMLEVGFYLASMQGTLVVAGVAVVSLLPIVLGARRKGGTILYAMLTAVALLGLAAVYLGLWLPAQELAVHLGDSVPVPPSFR